MRIQYAVLAGAVLLAGCATTPSPDPAGTARAADEMSVYDCDRYDCRQMEAVSRTARMQGVKVVWINPPQRLGRATDTPKRD